MNIISICRACGAIVCGTARFNLKARLEDYPEILADMLQELAKIDLPEAIAEKLPQFMCEGCTRRLLDAHDFVAQVRDATELMMKQLNKDESTVALECYQEPPIEHCSVPQFGDKIVIEAIENPKATQSSDLADVDAILKADAMILKQTLDSLDIGLLCDDIKQEIDESLDDVPLVNFANKRKSKKSKQLNNNSKISRKNTDSSASSEQLQCNKPFKCDLCERTFTQRGNMKTHRLTHTGEKPFKCDLCKKSFNQRGNMNNHRLKHTEEKSFKCDKNQKTFKQRGRPRVHQRNGEKPFKCDFCKMAFSQSCSLKTHRLTHTGEKPFKCDLCEKSFRQSGHLKTHRLKHTEEKPFKCDINEVALKQRGRTRDHRRI